MARGRGAGCDAAHQGRPRPAWPDEPGQGPAPLIRRLLPLLALAACAAPPREPPDPALAATGSVALVRSGQLQGCVATGGATHLGGGRFLTAAHVADGSVQRLRPGCAGAPVAVTLSVHGAESPARLLAAGQDRVEPGIGQRYLGGLDAALLAPSATLPSLPAARLCPRDPMVGEAVLLATPVRSVRTTIVDWHRDRDPAFGAYAELPLELAPGESGGAVFAREGCLLGLVSHRDSDAGPARTRIVPAPVLRRLAAG